MASSTASPATLPPGFRFHPTDEELVSFYLHRKISGQKIDFEVIAEIDLYKHEPWELPALSCLQTKDPEWYFFNPPDKKYPRGSRTNRSTKAGYWKATGKDRKVCSNSALVGMKKTLVFYKGRAPSGERTDWVMHEYQLLQGMDQHGIKDFNDALVLCRVIKKCGLGPKSRFNYFHSFNHGDQNQHELFNQGTTPTDLILHWSRKMEEQAHDNTEERMLLSYTSNPQLPTKDWLVNLGHGSHDEAELAQEHEQQDEDTIINAWGKDKMEHFNSSPQKQQPTTPYPCFTSRHTQHISETDDIMDNSKTHLEVAL